MSNQSSFPTALPGTGQQQKPPTMPSDDKQSLPVSAGNPQAVHHPQNNNNNNSSHAMSLPPAQQLLLQQNRNANVTHQQINKSMHQMTSMGGPNMNILQQMNHLVYQQQMTSGPSVTAAHNMQQHSMQGSVPQKFQNQQQQLHMRQNYGMSPPHVNTTTTVQTQQHMQYSPSKPIHPQMKTTAKLASPGSQLQTFQKSPPQGTSQLPTSQMPSLPLNPQITQSLPPAVNLNSSTPNLTTNSAPTQPAPSTAASVSSPQKSQVIPSPAKSVPPAAPASNVSANIYASNLNPIPQSAPQNISANNSSIVPSTATTLTSSSIAPQVVTANVTVKEPTVQITSSIPKEVKPIEVKSVTPQQASINDAGQKTIPTKVEEKKPSESPSKPSVSAPVEKPPAIVPKKTAQVASSPVVKSSTMRLATVTTPPRKKPPPTITKKVTPQSTQQKLASKSAVPAKSEAIVEKPQKTLPEIPKSSPPTTTAKSNKAETPVGPSQSNVTPKTQRIRTKVQLYQIPTPEDALVTKLSTQAANGGTNKNGEDKLTLFYKSEFLAVRNGEGGFYLCQAMHNVYRSSPKIKIRWLNETEEGKPNAAGGRTYTLDFYDQTDLECVLTTVDLEKVESKTYELLKEEITRIESILKKAIDVEKGILPRPSVTENNPDGLDLSIYKDESQLDKLSSRKRGKGKKSEDDDDYDDSDDDEPLSKRKKSTETPPKKTLTPRASARKPAVVEDESSESDEENLMEIKKKAKSQVEVNKAAKVTAKSSVDSSKEAKVVAKPVGAGRGRKRAVDKPAEMSPIKGAKVLKSEKVEEAKQPSPQKVSPKATKNSKSPAPTPAGKEAVKDKKQSAKDKPSDSTTVVKKETVSKVQTSPTAAVKGKSASKEKSVAPMTPVKKQQKEEESSTKTSPRGRNTRAKK